jgi:hypothetical protein
VVVAKLRESLVNKHALQTFEVERFNFNMLDDPEVNEQYQVMT